MALSMHQLCVPPLTRTLTSLRDIMKKAETHATAKSIDEKALIEFRLYPDMLPLRWQIYIATDTAKFAAKRLGELDAPKFEDTEATFEELDERLTKTIDFLQTVTPEQLDGTEDKEIVMKRRDRKWTMAGEQYLNAFVLPQVYFHVTTAYLILRHNGVELGKMDYLGATSS